MKTFSYSLLALGGLLIWGCNTPKVVATIEEPMIEERQLDTLVVSAPAVSPDEPEMQSKTYELATYNPSQKRTFDLLHTRLDLRFDWEKEQVIGKAQLELQPLFYASNTLTLDAKGFTFNAITLNGQALKYDYDDRQVSIELPREYTKAETITIDIDYVATPRPDGGSAAITSDKGLFFVNPRGEEEGKPQQIWTQGETEHNSRWFPTFDQPNERCTQEMYLTVADKYKTLSNGLLISSTKNDDGTRTDYWKMDQPHAPYLFMLTIGEFAVVEDTPWKGKPVNYYVEEEYEDYAKDIFPYTPDMLTFFSDVVDLEYPWSKYSQVVVRDYVSGAMENTTGVIFGEFMQGTDRELIDELINEKIVAHELFHHWFGDYVTCESWANLTLNEGFANYSEYLWLEHKYGRDEADYHMVSEWEGYLDSDEFHDLIFYDYSDKEQTFDAHSYNKGGAVLHMLRYMLGDEAFFASLNKYLNDNAYSAVEVDELRMAFEDVTGQDLQWFFNQWYLSTGHPTLNISYGYMDGKATVSVAQTQDAELMPAIFTIPTYVDIYMTGNSEPTRHEIMVNQREQTFSFPVTSEPALMVFDPEHTILAKWNEDKSTEQWAYQFMNAPRLVDRYMALGNLAYSEDADMSAIVAKGLNDSFWAIRGATLEIVEEDQLNEILLDQIGLMAKNDPHSDVRATAISMLADMEAPNTILIAKAALQARPYNVVSAGLSALAQLDPNAGVAAVGPLLKETNGTVISGIAKLYGATNDPKYLGYFVDNLRNVDGFAALSYYESYGDLLIKTGGGKIDEAIDVLENIGTNMGQSSWRRYAATSTINDLRTHLAELAEESGDTDAKRKQERATQAIENIKENETDPQMLSIYRQF